MGLVFSIGMTFVTFLFGESALSRTISGQLLRGQDSWGLLKSCQLFSKQLEIETPQIEVLESDLPLCFAVTSPIISILSQNESGNRICISTDILSRLTEDEIKALLANLCCKLQKSNKFVFSATNLIANSMLGVAGMFDKLIPKYKPFSTLISPLCWLLVRLGIGQQSIIEIDKMSSSIFQNKKALANVLIKLESLNITQPLKHIPLCSEHLFLVNPSNSALFKNPFSSAHPQVHKRVKDLVGYFPI